MILFEEVLCPSKGARQERAAEEREESGLRQSMIDDGTWLPCALATQAESAVVGCGSSASLRGQRLCNGQADYQPSCRSATARFIFNHQRCPSSRRPRAPGLRLQQP